MCMLVNMLFNRVYILAMKIRIVGKKVVSEPFVFFLSEDRGTCCCVPTSSFCEILKVLIQRKCMIVDLL